MSRGMSGPDVANRAALRLKKELPRLQSVVDSIMPESRLRLRMGDSTHTDGRIISIAPTAGMAQEFEHDWASCGEIDEATRRMACAACKQVEEINGYLYHEISHVLFGSFGNDRDAFIAFQDLRKLWDKNTMQAIMPRPSSSPALTAGASAVRGMVEEVNEFAPALINVLEDIRVDSQMAVHRTGTARMQLELLETVLTPDAAGEAWWKKAPLNAQIGIALIARAANFTVPEGWANEVEAALGSGDFDAPLKTLHNKASTVADTLAVTLHVLSMAKKHGFFLADNEREERSNESEDDTGSDNTDDNDSQPDEAGGPDGLDNGGVPELAGSEPGADDSDGTGPGDGSDGDGAEGSGGEAGAEALDGPPPEPASGGGVEGDGTPDGEEGGEHSGDSTPGAGESEGEHNSALDGAGNGGNDDGDNGGTHGGGNIHGGGERADSSEATDPEAGTEAPGDHRGDGRPDGHNESDSKAGAPAEGRPAAPVESRRPADGPSQDGDSESVPDEDQHGAGDGSPAEALDETQGERGDLGRGEADGAPEAECSDPLDYGTVDDFSEVIDMIGGRHNPKGGDPINTELPKDLVRKAIRVAEHFDDASQRINDVQVVDSPRALGMRRRAIEIEVLQENVRPALTRMRALLDDNKVSRSDRNRKSGRINAAALGKRAWNNDPRLFGKRARKTKKDYAVLIGIDVSGSTYMGIRTGRGTDRIINVELEAALSQIEVCHSLGIDFAVYAHTGSSEALQIVEVKRFDQRWDTKAIERFNGLAPGSCNLDGHTMEFYRKRLEEFRATDKILMYYTDGAMPNENYGEELRILQREMKVLDRLGITLMAVGIDSNAPTEYGIPTAVVRGGADVSKVVDHLEGVLSKAVTRR